MERAEEQGPFHTYYAIIKDEPKARADEDLAKKFRERLGRDSNVHVHRVSESKFVVKIMGDQALVDKIKTAMEAFPEVGQPHSPPAAPPGHGFGQCVCCSAVSHMRSFSYTREFHGGLLLLGRRVFCVSSPATGARPCAAPKRGKRNAVLSPRAGHRCR